MNLLRVILWAVLIYLVYNTVKNIMKYLSSSGNKGTSTESKPKKKSKYQIDKEDVIDAHFEEIDQKKSDKPNENS